eukprot:UN2177
MQLPNNGVQTTNALLQSTVVEASFQQPLFYFFFNSLNAKTENSEVFAYFFQMSAGKSAFETDSLDCWRLATSKDDVLMTVMPVFIMVVSISVLHASISFLAASSFFFASLHFARMSSTAPRSRPVPPLTSMV